MEDKKPTGYVEVSIFDVGDRSKLTEGLQALREEADQFRNTVLLRDLRIRIERETETSIIDLTPPLACILDDVCQALGLDGQSTLMALGDQAYSYVYEMPIDLKLTPVGLKLLEETEAAKRAAIVEELKNWAPWEDWTAKEKATT